jgi:hypothetical protein
MLRHSRASTVFNRQRYIKKHKNIWWVRKALWEKEDGFFSRFDIRSKEHIPVPASESYDRAKVKRETEWILKDYSLK